MCNVLLKKHAPSIYTQEKGNSGARFRVIWYPAARLVEQDMPAQYAQYRRSVVSPARPRFLLYLTRGLC